MRYPQIKFLDVSLGDIKSSDDGCDRSYGSSDGWGWGDGSGWGDGEGAGSGRGDGNGDGDSWGNGCGGGSGNGFGNGCDPGSNFENKTFPITLKFISTHKEFIKGEVYSLKQVNSFNREATYLGRGTGRELVLGFNEVEELVRCKQFIKL